MALYSPSSIPGYVMRAERYPPLLHSHSILTPNDPRLALPSHSAPQTNTQVSRGGGESNFSKTSERCRQDTRKVRPSLSPNSCSRSASIFTKNSENGSADDKENCTIEMSNMSEVVTPGHNWSEYLIEQNFSHQRHGCGALLLQWVDLSVVSRLSPFWENPPHLSLP